MKSACVIALAMTADALVRTPQTMGLRSMVRGLLKSSKGEILTESPEGKKQDFLEASPCVRRRPPSSPLRGARRPSKGEMSGMRGEGRARARAVPFDATET